VYGPSSASASGRVNAAFDMAGSFWYELHHTYIMNRYDAIRTYGGNLDGQ
jgi:hypothetical protein